MAQKLQLFYYLLQNSIRSNLYNYFTFYLAGLEILLWNLMIFTIKMVISWKNGQFLSNRPNRTSGASWPNVRPNLFGPFRPNVRPNRSGSVVHYQNSKLWVSKVAKYDIFYLEKGNLEFMNFWKNVVYDRTRTVRPNVRPKQTEPVRPNVRSTWPNPEPIKIRHFDEKINHFHENLLDFEMIFNFFYQMICKTICIVLCICKSW